MVNNAAQPFNYTEELHHLIHVTRHPSIDRCQSRMRHDPGLSDGTALARLRDRANLDRPSGAFGLIQSLTNPQHVKSHITSPNIAPRLRYTP